MQVLRVRVRSDCFAVTMDDLVVICARPDGTKLRELRTCANPVGLLAMSTAADLSVVACPGLEQGSVRAQRFDVYSAVQQACFAANQSLVAC